MTQLLKVHGSENQFFILDQSDLSISLKNKELKNLAIDITSSKNKILGGADGLLVINPPQIKNTLGEMCVFNSDGSEASMCGNGLRTVARYLFDKYQKDEFNISTIHDVIHHTSRKNNLSPGVPAFSVEISPISFDQQSLPFKNLGTNKIIDHELPQILKDTKFTAISVPNPHLIAFNDNHNLDTNTLGQIGNKLNHKNPYFTDGVNISFARIIDKNKIFVHTFERGVGFTNACGTGMAATSLAFAITHQNWYEPNKEIKVYNPGGMVRTKINHNESTINLIGNATITDVINVNEKNLHQANLNINNVKIESTGEEKYYQQFVKDIKN